MICKYLSNNHATQIFFKPVSKTLICIFFNTHLVYLLFKQHLCEQGVFFVSKTALLMTDNVGYVYEIMQGVYFKCSLPTKKFKKSIKKMSTKF